MEPINQSVQSPPANQSVKSPPANLSVESPPINQSVQCPPPALPSSPRKRKTENLKLPEEMLLEIFCRLPTKCVARNRILSRTWRRELSTPEFIRSHANRKPKEENVILISADFELNTISIPINTYRVKRELNWPNRSYQILGSCQGLVLLLAEDWEDDFIIVFNPIIGEQVNIRVTGRSINPFVPSISYGFGYDSSCDDYKVVCLSHGFDGSANIYVFSMRGADWKSIDVSPYDHNVTQKQNGVFLNGAIHWLVGKKDSDKLVIAAFDLASETFREIPAPIMDVDDDGDYDFDDDDDDDDDDRDYFSSYGLHVVGGFLFLAQTYSEEDVDIWIMKQYGVVNSWTNFSTTIPGKTLYTVTPVCFIEEKEVVILTKKGKLYVFNLANGKTEEVIVDGRRRKFREGGNFMGSFVKPSEIAPLLVERWEEQPDGRWELVTDQGSKAELK